MAQMSNRTDIAWAPFDLLERFVVDVFKALGVPPVEARICADVLMESDRRGIDSHGVGRFKPIYYDRIRKGVQNPVTHIEIIRNKGATAVLDGHNGMGQVIAFRAMEMAIRKARDYGLGMVAVRNSTHYGIAGYYPLMAASQGMIGISGTNARPSVAPTFGVENMLGTNPLVFAIPTDEDFPFCIDCATSVTQRGKIETYARTGKPLPPGWVIDRKGRTRTDPEQVLKDLVAGRAALTPLGGLGEDTGGHKGYGYSVAVEMLSAALQGGSYLHMLTGLENGRPAPPRLGHFFIAISVEHFTDLGSFKAITGDICRRLRNSQKAPGATRIYTAGEKERRAWLERKDKGVPLDKVVQKELCVIRDEMALTRYRFPFENRKS